MKATAAIAVGAAFALLGTQAAPSASENVYPKPQETQIVTHPQCTASEFRVQAKESFHPWYRRATERWKLRELKGCAQNRKTFRAMKRIQANQQAGKKKAVRRYHALTPYPGCGQLGRSAIPTYIVYRESRCTWNAYNSSSAAGPYQLMGEWGRPYPVYGMDEKMAHHRIASDLWAGGAGCSNWMAC